MIRRRELCLSVISEALQLMMIYGSTEPFFPEIIRNWKSRENKPQSLMYDQTYKHFMKYIELLHQELLQQQEISMAS
jgi:hypothetical protein